MIALLILNNPTRYRYYDFSHFYRTIARGTERLNQWSKVKCWERIKLFAIYDDIFYTKLFIHIISYKYIRDIYTYQKVI